MNYKSKKKHIVVNGQIKHMTTIHDEKGTIIHRIIENLHHEVKAKDFVQMVVGASILSIPVAFTEETWRLGQSLSWLNILGLLVLSLLFLTIFIYYSYYRNHLKGNISHFFIRLFATYGFSVLVVASLLTLIDKAPWGVDMILAFKRIIIVALPASMSAAVADVMK